MNGEPSHAPGWPGIAPRWTSSAKSGIGTSLSPVSRVWFTISHGILNEIYYPRVDQACTRDLGLIVTDGSAFLSEEKRHARSRVEYLAEGAAAYRLVNTCTCGRYRIEKEVLTDPQRDVVLQWTRFVPLQGDLADYRLYVLLAPHLGNRGAGNTAWVGDYKGLPMLFAQRGGIALALASSVPWLQRSVGFVGTSDGWQDLTRHKQMTWNYSRAEDGHWSQNMWLDGTPYWTGVQMDETALPILLVDLARRQRALRAADVRRLWPMVRRAAGFVVRNGPVTQQDRWEEDAGYSPSTLAAQIAALLAAADWADMNREPSVADYLRQTADIWNDCIDRWIYVSGTDLAVQLDVEGYYLRIAPPEEAEAASPVQGFVPIKNRPPGESCAPAAHVVSPDALALVRFGLRAPDDPRIVATVRVIDLLLRVQTPSGPAWHRYNGDGYGEHADGSPFDGSGIGRAWPLLTGERAHYELAAGRRDQAERLLHTMESFANEGGMLPEQVWDAADVSQRDLRFGKPSGSAMPLVWAHAEYIKLRRSLRDGRVFDMPDQPVKRYLLSRPEVHHAIWRCNHKSRTMPAGRMLRIELHAPARIRWGTDGWQQPRDAETRDAGLGVFLADLPTGGLPSGAAVNFTIYWLQEARWEGTDYTVIVE